MKVLIQNTGNWKYLTGADWAASGENAEDFQTISHAQETAEAKGIEAFRIVGYFITPDHHAMEIPITG